MPRGYSAHILLDYLKANRIQGEMSDHRNVVLLFGTNNTRQDFENLYDALKRCDLEKLKDKCTIPIDSDIPSMKVMPWEAIDSEKEKLPIGKARNRVCGQAVVPYPPGIPIVMPGELIEEGTVETINYYIDNKVTLLGLEEGMITVLKN